MAAEKLIGSCLEVTSVILQIWKGVKRRSWGLLSVLGWCNVLQSDRFFQLAFIHPLHRAKANRERSFLSRKQDGSEAQSLFHPPWKKQKLKTDSVSSHRSRQLMKTTTPKYVSYRHKSQNDPRVSVFTESTRQRAYSLVAQAYTSITAEDFAAFVGYSVEEAVKGTNVSTGRDEVSAPLKPLYCCRGTHLLCVLFCFFPSQRRREPGLASRPCYQDGDAQEAR